MTTLLCFAALSNPIKCLDHLIEAQEPPPPFLLEIRHDIESFRNEKTVQEKAKLAKIIEESIQVHHLEELFPAEFLSEIQSAAKITKRTTLPPAS